MTQNRHLLVVYGTLKRGHSNHHFLRQAEIIEDVAISGYWLTDLGDYPGAVTGSPDDECFGELYRVSDETLAACDELEDINVDEPLAGEYRKERINTRTGSAFIYVYNGEGERPPFPIKRWKARHSRA